MKRYFNIAVAALVIAGCAKENNPSENVQPVVRKTIEVGLDATKTSLGTEVAGRFPVLWSEGDEIAVVDNMGVAGKQNCSVYRLKTGAGTSNGVFEHVSGNAFPAVIKDVIYPASAMAPQGVELDKIPVTSMEALVPQVQNQTYVKNSFDPKAAVMAFHSDAAQQQTIVLQPASSIVCIPVVGQTGDVVNSVVWQHMDGRTVTVTLNCPGGVELSSKPTNFYLSIPPMKKEDCNGIAYVHLKNGAVQVKTPKNMTAFKAGELHRFATWTLSRKTKWTIKYIGSERDHTTQSGTPLGPGKYMIDDNPLSWWEFKRNSQKQMSGPHKVIIDLGKTEHIKGLKVKGPETNKTPQYEVDGVTVKLPNGYCAPFSVYASFLGEGELTDKYINTFKQSSNWYESAQEQFTAVASDGRTITYYYGNDMKTWWNLSLKQARDARYLVIHFRQGWNFAGTGSADNVMKVAELDIY